MFRDKAPFYYRCMDCGYFFISDKNLHAPSNFSFISLDFDNNDDMKEINLNDIKKESILKKIYKRIFCPKCPKCQKHSLVSIDSIIHK